MPDDAGRARTLTITTAHELVGHGADYMAGQAIGLKGKNPGTAEYASAAPTSPVYVTLTVGADGRARITLAPVAQELMAAWQAGRLPAFAQVYEALAEMQRDAVNGKAFAGEDLKNLNAAVREAQIEAWPRLVEAMTVDPALLKAIAPLAYAWADAALKARSAEQMGGILSGRTAVKGVNDGRAANATADRGAVSASDARVAAGETVGRAGGRVAVKRDGARDAQRAGPEDQAGRPRAEPERREAGRAAGVEPAPRPAAPRAAGDQVGAVRARERSGSDGGLEETPKQTAPAPKAKVDYKLLGQIAGAAQGKHSPNIEVLPKANLPTVLRMFGESLPIYLEISNIRHLAGKHSEITPQDIAALPDLLQRPRAVLRHREGLTFILDSRDGQGNPIRVGLTPGSPRQGSRSEQAWKINRVSTAFGWENSGNAVLQALRDGQVRYLSKEGLARAQELLSTASIAAQSPDRSGATTSLAKPASPGATTATTMAGKPANARAKNSVARATFYSDRAVGAFRSGQNWRAMQETLDVHENAEVFEEVAFQRAMAREDEPVQAATQVMLKEPKGSPAHAGGVIRQVLHEYVDLTLHLDNFAAEWVLLIATAKGLRESWRSGEMEYDGTLCRTRFFIGFFACVPVPLRESFWGWHQGKPMGLLWSYWPRRVLPRHMGSQGTSVDRAVNRRFFFHPTNRDRTPPQRACVRHQKNRGWAVCCPCAKPMKEYAGRMTCKQKNSRPHKRNWPGSRGSTPSNSACWNRGTPPSSARWNRRTSSCGTN